MKTMVIGYSGSGKSTLARFLSERQNAPVLYLDRVYWLPGWQKKPLAEQQTEVEAFLNENENWVIDGNYTKVLWERRLQEADRIILMDFGRWSCFFRAYRRYRTNRNRSRFSMTEGCDEKFDREFMRWILRDGRTDEVKERYRKLQQGFAEKVIVLHNQRELDAFLNAQ